MPKAYVTRINDVLVKALQSPEAKAQLATEAAEPVGNSPEEFGRFIKAEIARWGPVVKQSGAKADEFDTSLAAIACCLDTPHGPRRSCAMSRVFPPQRSCCE